MPTTKLLHYVGIPAFALFSIALHLWAVLVAFAVSGHLASIWTFMAPVISWVWWSAHFWRETGIPVNAFSLAVILWIACAACLWLAKRVGEYGHD